MGIPLEIITGEHRVWSIYRIVGVCAHLAVSGEPGVPREELHQAGHGVQVVLALPAPPRLARRLVVVVTGL